jgi:hypothetical protein
MDVNYSAAINPDLDQPVYEAQAERPGKPIRIRLQPTIYRIRDTGGQQQAWTGVSWILECRTAEEAVALKEALRVFFDAVAASGPAAVGGWLAARSAE